MAFFNGSNEASDNLPNHKAGSSSLAGPALGHADLSSVFRAAEVASLTMVCVGVVTTVVLVVEGVDVVVDDDDGGGLVVVIVVSEVEGSIASASVRGFFDSLEGGGDGLLIAVVRLDGSKLRRRSEEDVDVRRRRNSVSNDAVSYKL